jgi:hypothetical protein
MLTTTGGRLQGKRPCFSLPEAAPERAHAGLPERCLIGCFRQSSGIR